MFKMDGLELMYFFHRIGFTDLVIVVLGFCQNLGLCLKFLVCIYIFEESGLLLITKRCFCFFNTTRA